MKPLKPIDARSIAEAHSPELLAEYLDHGLSCYREEFELGTTGNSMVTEGYLQATELPNGKVFYTRKQVRTFPRKQIEEEG